MESNNTYKRTQRMHHRAARTFEGDSSLAAEGSLPHTPAVMSLGVKLAVGIHDGLPAAAKLLGLLSQGVTAGSSQSAEFVDVAAALPDELDKLGHINLLSTAGVNWVLLSVDHLGGFMGPEPKTANTCQPKISHLAMRCRMRAKGCASTSIAHAASYSINLPAPQALAKHTHQSSNYYLATTSPVSGKVPASELICSSAVRGCDQTTARVATRARVATEAVRPAATLILFVTVPWEDSEAEHRHKRYPAWSLVLFVTDWLACNGRLGKEGCV